MRDFSWHRSAHLRLKNAYGRYFSGAALAAAALVGLLAIFSPPYIPSPYTLAVAEPFEAEQPPEFEIPAKPAEVATPAMPSDIDPFEGPGPEDLMPAQLRNPMVSIRAAARRLPSQAPPAYEEPPAVVRSVAPDYPEIAGFIRCPIFPSGQRITEIGQNQIRVEHLMVYGLAGSISSRFQAFPE